MTSWGSNPKVANAVPALVQSDKVRHRELKDRSNRRKSAERAYTSGKFRLFRIPAPPPRHTLGPRPASGRATWEDFIDSKRDKCPAPVLKHHTAN
eukprot:gene23682-biopygen14889